VPAGIGAQESRPGPAAGEAAQVPVRDGQRFRLGRRRVPVTMAVIATRRGDCGRLRSRAARGGHAGRGCGRETRTRGRCLPWALGPWQFGPGAESADVRLSFQEPWHSVVRSPGPFSGQLGDRDASVWRTDDIGERGIGPLKAQQTISGRLTGADVPARLEIRSFIGTAIEHGGTCSPSSATPWPASLAPARPRGCRRTQIGPAPSTHRPKLRAGDYLTSRRCSTLVRMS
jgi:hypothetical protein